MTRQERVYQLDDNAINEIYKFTTIDKNSIKKAISVALICEECKDGEMISHPSKVLLSNPVQYPHECNMCGCKENLRSQYPQIKIVRREENG
jgi:hypothetical protein